MRKNDEDPRNVLNRRMSVKSISKARQGNPGASKHLGSVPFTRDRYSTPEKRLRYIAEQDAVAVASVGGTITQSLHRLLIKTKWDL